MTTLIERPRPLTAPTVDRAIPAPTPRDPRWVRPAFVGLLVATALLYLWGLGASGWANSFYSAAVQAGSESWKAFFFGSSDAANAITVDKTPLALWPMALSVRIFGLSSWAILVPQALEGVASVALLYVVVRRSTGSPVAGLLAGTVLATTPVAALMFRFNNPDALLVLLMIAAAAATLRAVENPQRALRWVCLGGALVGLAFLTKMLQAFLVLPALALTYLLFAQTTWAKRVLHLLAAFGSMIVAGGWWIAIVELWPAASRPYIGGSQSNSILELTLGYNGLGRLNGNEVGSVGGGGPGGGSGSMWGSTGILRMFGSDAGAQIAWLLPAALVLGVAAFWLTRKAAVRASTTLWLGWLLVTALTFSFMAGIFHAYYTVALAPAIAALVGTGAWLAWERRATALGVSVLAGATALTSTLAFMLLGRADEFLPWLRWVILVGGLLAAAGLACVNVVGRRVAGVIAAAALVVSLAAPTAYAVETAATPHTGSIPSAGPASAGRSGSGGGPGGGLLNGSTSTSAVTAKLQENAVLYRWAAAAIGSNVASGYQLASGEPVMAIGGFNGSDPSPTLAQFKAYVAAGDIHWFIASSDRGGPGGGPGGGGGMSPGGSTSSGITEWVKANFTSVTVDGVTLYDLSAGAGA